MRRRPLSCFIWRGVNRPKDPGEFLRGQPRLHRRASHLLAQAGNKAPVLVTSSVQAELDNDYGRSKREAEELIFAHERATGAPALVYRLPGVFGKWCRPAYNSVVATFCHNIAHGQPIEVRDRAYTLPLVYIDDVADAFIGAMEGPRRAGLLHPWLLPFDVRGVPDEPWASGGHHPQLCRKPRHAGRAGYGRRPSRASCMPPTSLICLRTPLRTRSACMQTRAAASRSFCARPNAGRCR